MIHYALVCDKGHEFDGWFRSSSDYLAQREAEQITCVTCGSIQIERGLMAPAVASKSRIKNDKTKQTPLEKLRAHIEATSSYVGLSFADQARAMHEGQMPERAIHGEAKAEDARKLIEDGIPVAPLPFLPRQKTN